MPDTTTSKDAAAHEAERCLIGSCILDPTLIPECSQLVQREHFESNAARLVWDAVLSLHARHAPIDSMLLFDELTQRNTLDAAGGPDALAGYMTIVPSAANGLYYAKIVHDAAVQKAAVAALDWGLKEARRSPLNGDTREHLNGIVSGLSALVKEIPDGPASPHDAQEPEDANYEIPDFPTQSLGGIWQDWIANHAKTTEAPAVYAVASLMMAASLAINRRCWVVCGTKLYPNWYALILGSTGERKSTALERLEALLPILDKSAIHVSGFGSSEGLLKAIHSQKAEDANILLTLSEAGVLLKKVCRARGQREVAGAGIAMVNRFFDGCPALVSNPVASGESVQVKRPLLSIFGCATPKTAGLLFNEDAIEEGLCNRFVFFPGKTTEYLDRPGLYDGSGIQKLHDEVVRLANLAGTVGEFTLTPEAADLNRSWYIKARKDGTLDSPVHKRLQTHMLKFALVHAALRQSPVIDAEDISKAILVASFWERAAMHLYAFWSGSELDRAIKRVLHHVTLHQPVKRRAIQMRTTGRNGIPKAVFIRAVGYLLRERAIVSTDNGYVVAQ